MAIDQLTVEQIVEALTPFIQKGDLKGGQKYVTDNLSRFPRELQGEILTQMVSDGLEKAVQTEKQIDRMQRIGLANLDELEHLQEYLKKQKGE